LVIKKKKKCRDKKNIYIGTKKNTGTKNYTILSLCSPSQLSHHQTKRKKNGNLENFPNLGQFNHFIEVSSSKLLNNRTESHERRRDHANVSR
jgi:hypothetical protein